MVFVWGTAIEMGMKNVENNLLYDKKIETVRGRKYDQSKEATGKYSFASKRRKFFPPQNIFNRHSPLQKHHGQSLTNNLAAFTRIDILKSLTKPFKALCRHLSLITPPI